MTLNAVEKELDIIRNLAKSILNRAKFRKKNPHPITITPDWVVDRFLKVKGKCEYTGVPLYYKGKRGRKHHLISHPFRLTIDRIDSYKGYHPDNCRLCIWEANRFKGVRYAGNFKRDYLKTHGIIYKSITKKK